MGCTFKNFKYGDVSRTLHLFIMIVHFFIFIIEHNDGSSYWQWSLV